MTNRKRLKPAELRAALKKVKGWKLAGKRLERSYDFKAYAAGLDFAVRLGRLADRMNHHPDLLVGYGRVAVQWTTHDSGGVTPMDVDAARITDAVFREVSGLPPRARM